MEITIESIEEAARTLTIPEKARLARTMLDDITGNRDEEIEALWLAEAERRYEAYRRGEMQAYPGDEVIARARKLVRQQSLIID